MVNCSFKLFAITITIDFYSVPNMYIYLFFFVQNEKWNYPTMEMKISFNLKTIDMINSKRKFSFRCCLFYESIFFFENNNYNWKISLRFLLSCLFFSPCFVQYFFHLCLYHSDLTRSPLATIYLINKKQWVVHRAIRTRFYL